MVKLLLCLVFVMNLKICMTNFHGLTATREICKILNLEKFGLYGSAFC